MIFIIGVYIVITAILVLVLDLKKPIIDHDEEIDLTIISIMKATSWPIAAIVFVIMYARRLAKKGLNIE